ncbi:aminoacyl-tRNA hydrolase [Buchnera aphidicola]|uniref:aminoacyl-tRNA hydrolase n=1 Tax=Buchnera aphidicola TaxID=9 RepID=UPI00094D87CA|nr:aminoacyl-tRNA hydrolase [Buchnera aphidicola]
MSIIKLIIGLGNPYKNFYHTRHNVGMWYLRILVDYYKLKLEKHKKFSGKFSILIKKNHKILFFQPEIFMNLSGSLIFNIASYYKIKLSEILVIRDELDLFPGFLKIKYSSSHNGHNGIKSIISSFKKKSSFMQLCIGIGRPQLKNEITKFVLSAPTKIEKRLIFQIMMHFMNKNSNFIYNLNLFLNKKISILQ